MEAVKTLKTALAAINGTLAKLREELAETNGQLGTVSRRIAELQEMPISLDDYGLRLKALIEQRADEHMKMCEFALFRKSGGNIPRNTISWDGHDDIGQFPEFFFGGTHGEHDMICAFFGDLIYQNFMARAKEKFGERWGNTQYPPVAERRKMIAELEQQAEELKKKRAELEGQINEITGDLQV